jgi:hypothetical protein
VIFTRKFISYPDIPIKTKNAAPMPVDDMKAKIHVTAGIKESK